MCLKVTCHARCAENTPQHWRWKTKVSAAAGQVVARRRHHAPETFRLPISSQCTEPTKWRVSKVTTQLRDQSWALKVSRCRCSRLRLTDETVAFSHQMSTLYSYIIPWLWSLKNSGNSTQACFLRIKAWWLRSHPKDVKLQSVRN